MVQQVLLKKVTKTNLIHEALLLCSKCEQIVPKTIVCLYCGAKISDNNPN
jgi:hypothetical protein